MNKWQNFFEELNYQLNPGQIYLMAGGLAGHMLHPSDMDNKEDFINFFDDFISGKLTATEKVDGFNLFVGYNRAGKVVAARNKTEEPFENADQKFRLSHGGRPAFLGGFKAVKSFLERLPTKKRIEYQLINPDGTPKNFINLEIIYGPKPNIVPYSQTDNFIVFHTLSGTKETDYEKADFDDKSILTKMAQKAKTTTSVQSEPEYVGEEITRKFKQKSSFWAFKGPIKFTGDQLKNMIDTPDLKSLWKKRRAELKAFIGIGDELHSKLKDVALEIGAVILKKVKSKLSDIPAEPGQPGVEGLVVPYKGRVYKITGDFGAIYRDIERPPNFLSSLTDLIGNKILKIKLKRIDKRNVDKYGSVSKLLAARNPKFDYDQLLKEKQQVLDEIDKTSKNVRSYQDKLRGVEAAGWKGFLYDLQEFKKAVNISKTYKDLARAYFEKLFWRKSKLSESLDKIRREL